MAAADDSDEPATDPDDRDSALAEDLLGPKPQADREPPDRSRRFKIVEAIIHLTLFLGVLMTIGGLGVLAAAASEVIGVILVIVLLVVLVTAESKLDDTATWLTEKLVEE